MQVQSACKYAVQPDGMLRGCGAVQYSAVRCGLQASREDRQRQRGVGRRRRALGGWEDKGLAWALSFFPRQYVLISCGEE